MIQLVQEPEANAGNKAREFYIDIGFTETDFSSELIVTEQTANTILLDIEQRRQQQPFD